MPPIDGPRAAPRFSLFRSGVGLRLALAALLALPVWAAIAWALAA